MLPWGLDPNLDSQFKSKFALHQPPSEVSYGIRGYGGNLSLIVPSSGPRSNRWQLSSILTALHTISAVAFTSTLMNVESMLF